MAFRCGFFTSVNGDRKYGVDDISKLITSVISDGVVADDAYSDGLQVQAYEGLKIIVKKGIGIFFNKWCENDADMIFTVPTPDVTSTRVDSVVIRVDISDEVRNGFLEYKTGESNTPPALENSENVKEYRLANITVAPNISAITQANIEDTRPTSECGFVTNLLQNSDITATYSQWQSQFEQWIAKVQSEQEEQEENISTWFENSQTEFNQSQEEKQEVFNQSQENRQSSFVSTIAQNQNSFDAWFSNVKETLASNTLISSFTSKYVTTSQDETVIPIGIEKYKSVLDILQVYINGLLCFENTDYTVDGFNNIVLTKGVDKGTVVHFVVYKSQDGSNIENFVEDLNDLIERQETIEIGLDNLESSLNTTKTGFTNQLSTLNTTLSQISTKANTNATNITKINTEITNLKKEPTALWTGANTMGDGVTITPSKKLSACKNGWILIWCGYNTTDEIATNTRFNSVVVPKTLLASIPANYMPFYCNLAHNVYNSGNVEYNAKMVQIWDDKITGFAGNTATDVGKGFCLKQVIEF